MRNYSIKIDSLHWLVFCIAWLLYSIFILVEYHFSYNFLLLLVSFLFFILFSSFSVKIGKNIISGIYILFSLFYTYIFLNTYVNSPEVLVNRMVLGIGGDEQVIDIYVIIGLASIYFAFSCGGGYNFLFLVFFGIFNVLLMNRSASIIIMLSILYFAFKRLGPFLFIILLFLLLYYLISFDFSDSLLIIKRFEKEGLTTQRTELINFGLSQWFSGSFPSTQTLEGYFGVKSFHFYPLDLARVSNSFILFIIAIFLFLFILIFIFLTKRHSILIKFTLSLLYVFFLFMTPSFDLSSYVVLISILPLMHSALPISQ
jgi:hypothetical protein